MARPLTHLTNLISHLTAADQRRFAIDCAEHVEVALTGHRSRPTNRTESLANKAAEWARKSRNALFCEDPEQAAVWAARNGRRAAAQTETRDFGSPEKWDAETAWQIERAEHYYHTKATN